MAENKMEYFENLASVGIACPHTDAVVPDGSKSYYRYIPGGTVSSDSFLPTKINSDRPLPNGFDDCIGKSVSIFDDINGLINGVFRLPHHKGKKRIIGVINLGPNDGVVKQTFDNINHHSWWRTNDFEPSTVTTQEIIIE